MTDMPDISKLGPALDLSSLKKTQPTQAEMEQAYDIIGQFAGTIAMALSLVDQEQETFTAEDIINAFVNTMIAITEGMPPGNMQDILAAFVGELSTMITMVRERGGSWKVVRAAFAEMMKGQL